MLNQSQLIAKKQYKQFLFDKNQKFFCIDSPAGFGKTFLLNALHDDMQNLNKQLEFLGKSTYDDMLFTATTNKASAVLNDAMTVHKTFGLRVFDDYKSGKSRIAATKNTMNLSDIVLVVDEASMIPPELFQLIDKYTQDSKVIFVGDSNQLAPINHTKPVVFSQGYPTAVLDEPMRQDKDSFLYQSCLSLRTGVIKQEYSPLVQGEGIRFVDGNTFKQEITQSFADKEDARVLAYTNHTVENLNKFVRKQLHSVSGFRVGDPVIAANTCEGKVRVESTYHIETLSEPYDNGFMMVQDVTLKELSGIFTIPVDKQDYFSKVKRAKQEGKQDGNWVPYFALLNNYLDIRDGFACTVNKSQGSTYNKVFIDFSNLATCRDLNTFLRLFYVAVSRAKQEVIIYGL